MRETGYDRRAAVEYALKWAYSANPRYYYFDAIGGDCTNFISQCLYAGCGVMNYSQENGWYYINLNNRSPSWTGVVFLREFLLTNKGAGVYGEEAPLGRLERGDLIQLENGTTMSLNLADIVEYRKEKNPNYVPVTDIELTEDEAAINRNIGTLIPTEEVSGIVTVNTDSLNITVPSNTPNITAEFNMSYTKAQQLKLIRVRKYQDKKGKKTYYGFTYEEMVKNAIIPQAVETSVNGISKLKYTLPNSNQGVYGIYDSATNKIIIFRISD